MNEPLVTVVTPVYNGARYLAECIESVLAQTYRNLEYVIVNNRSTDDTEAIAQRYAERDARVRVVTNSEFVGVIQNHNIAFRQVSPASAYCKMVHADDWLFPECIAQMVAVAEAYPSVGMVGAYRLHGDRIELDGLPYPSAITAGRDICRAALLRGLHVFGSPTATLIRADIIRRQEPFYNEANIHADTEICYDILRDHDWGFVHQVLTFTRSHPQQNTAYTRRMNTYALANLHDLTTYGPRYLTHPEYTRRVEEKLDQYYSFLGRSVLQRRDAAFWQLHRKGMAELGFPFSRWRLARATAHVILDRALNPKRTLEGGARRWARRVGAPQTVTQPPRGTD